MSWLFYALAASAMWGLTYVLGESLYRRLSVDGTLFLANVPLVLMLGCLSLRGGALKADLKTLQAAPRLAGMLLLLSLVWTLAEFAIATSISGKNAVVAGLIEISYPLWIAGFSALLIGTARLTPAVALGGLFVFAGVSIIAWTQR